MDPERTFFIAEAGVNHNGSVDLAMRLVDVAAEAGADAVKFQSFRAAQLVSRHAEKAGYQKATTLADESQLAMLQRLELSESEQRAVAAHASARGIRFMSTPFDISSLEVLLSLGVSPIKVSSGDVTYAQLLHAIGASDQAAILSTGMCTLGDVESALAVLASGYLSARGETATPAEALRSAAGQAVLRANVTLLHCTTEYPAPFQAVNLHAMATLRDAFGLPVGYSDHTAGTAVALAAVALGARVIEKHYTLDRAMDGPDHAASLEPRELGELVRAVRDVEVALGRPQKLPSGAEIPNLAVARRSLVATRAIRAGETFDSTNLGAKRPGTGISAMRFSEWLGKTADRDYDDDALIVDGPVK